MWNRYVLSTLKAIKQETEHTAYTLIYTLNELEVAEKTVVAGVGDTND